MAYGNMYPATYPQYAYPVYQQPMPAQQPQSAPLQATPAPAPNAGGIIWVQGEAGAKSYLVAPNTTVQLWDSEKQTIYLKSADACGMPSMKTLDYTIRDQNTAQQAAPDFTARPAADYATKSDIEALSGKLSRLRADLDELSARREKKRREDDE